MLIAQSVIAIRDHGDNQGGRLPMFDMNRQRVEQQLLLASTLFAGVLLAVGCGEQPTSRDKDASSPLGVSACSAEAESVVVLERIPRKLLPRLREALVALDLPHELCASSHRGVVLRAHVFHSSELRATLLRGEWAAYLVPIEHQVGVAAVPSGNAGAEDYRAIKELLDRAGVSFGHSQRHGMIYVWVWQRDGERALSALRRDPRWEATWRIPPPPPDSQAARGR